MHWLAQIVNRIRCAIGMIVGAAWFLLGGNHVNIGYWPWQKGYWE